MSTRWILLALMSLPWMGCGEATVRPFVESIDAGVDAGDGEDDGGEEDDDGGIDDDDGGIDDDELDDLSVIRDLDP